METFGTRLRAARTRRNISMTDLAANIGVSHGSVSAWEAGHTATPQYGHALRLADALGVNARWLVLGDGPETGEKPSLDVPMLESVIRGVYEELSTHDLTLTAAKMAHLIAVLYEHHIVSEMERVDRKAIVRFTRLTAPNGRRPRAKKK